MGDRDRHMRIYDLHSWTGMAFGLIIFVVCFSGCMALFEHELGPWEDPAKRLSVPAKPVAYEPLFTDFYNEVSEKGEITTAQARFPNALEPYLSVSVRYKTNEVSPDGTQRQASQDITRRWNAETGDVLPERGDGAAHWLLDFHRYFMLPRTVGRALVGITGILMMLSILSGVITHTKILRELFTLRYARTVRLKWQDTHKVLGVWGLPFYSMMAFTGAYLGIVVLLGPIIAFLAFKGDTDALFDAVVGSSPDATGVAAQMLTLDELAQYRHAETGAHPAMVVVEHWGDEAGSARLFYHSQTELARFDVIQISGMTGYRLPENLTTRRTAATRVLNAVTPLHYGTYGGVALKFLYLVLGIAMSVITALGLMMWIERRLHGSEGKRSPNFYRKLSRLNVGGTMGLVVSSATLFHVDKLYSGPEESRLLWIGISFFSVWTLVIAYALRQTNDYGTTRRLMFATSVTLMVLPITNAFISGSLPFSPSLNSAVWVDVSFAVIGAVTGLVAWKLPKSRPTSNPLGKQQGEHTLQNALAPAE